MILLSVIILISIVTIFVSPHNPTAQNIDYINLPPRIPGLNIDGLNGKAMVGGELVDKYAQANVPANVNFFLGTDGLGRDVLSRLFMGTRISLLIAFILCIIRCDDRCCLWADFWSARRTNRQRNATFLRDLIWDS